MRKLFLSAVSICAYLLFLFYLHYLARVFISSSAYCTITCWTFLLQLFVVEEQHITPPGPPP